MVQLLLTMNTLELPIIAFTTPKDFEQWLEKNHETAPGVWVQMYKKTSGVQSINWAGAVETALCFGWIDSKAKGYDDTSHIQKFTPRRAKSIWSKINTGHIERLIKEGRMKPAGMKVVEEAKKDGRWEAAYNSPSTMTLPKEFLEELKKDKKAEAFFETLNKTNKYAIAWRLETAKKPETKEKRMKTILEMLSVGEKFH